MQNRRQLRSDSLITPIPQTSAGSPLNLTTSSIPAPFPSGQTQNGGDGPPPLQPVNAIPSQPLLSSANLSYGFRFPTNTPPVPSSLNGIALEGQTPTTGTTTSHPSQVVSSPLNGIGAPTLGSSGPIAASGSIGNSGNTAAAHVAATASILKDYLGIHPNPNVPNPILATAPGNFQKERDGHNTSIPYNGPRQSISLIRNMGMLSGGAGPNGQEATATNSIFSPAFDLRGLSGRPNSGGFLQLGGASDFGGDRPTPVPSGGVSIVGQPPNPPNASNTNSASAGFLNLYQTNNTMIGGNNNTVHTYNTNIVIPNLVIGNFHNNMDIVGPSNLHQQSQGQQAASPVQAYSPNHQFSQPQQQHQYQQQPYTMLHNVRISADDLMDLSTPIEILPSLQSCPNTTCTPTAAFKPLVTNTLLGLAAATHAFLEARKVYNRHPTPDALDRLLIRTAVLDYVSEEVLGNFDVMERVEPSSLSLEPASLDRRKESAGATSLLTAMGWGDHHHIPRRSLTPSPAAIGAAGAFGGVNRNPLLSPAALSSMPDPGSLISPKMGRTGVLSTSSGLHLLEGYTGGRPTATVTTIPGAVPNRSGSSEQIDGLMGAGTTVTNVPKSGGLHPPSLPHSAFSNADPLAPDTNPESTPGTLTTSASAPALFGGTTSSANVLAPTPPIMAVLAAEWTSMWHVEKTNQFGEEAATGIFQLSLTISQTFRLVGNLDRFEKDGAHEGGGAGGISPVSGRRRRWSDSQNDAEEMRVVDGGGAKDTTDRHQSPLADLRVCVGGILDDIQHRVLKAHKGRGFLYILKAAISRIVILILFFVAIGSLLGTVAIAILNENAVKDALDELAEANVKRKVPSLSIFGPAAVSLACSLCQMILMLVGSSFTRLVPNLVNFAFKAAKYEGRGGNSPRRKGTSWQELFHRISPFSVSKSHQDMSGSPRGRSVLIGGEGAAALFGGGYQQPDKSHAKRMKALMNVVAGSAERLCRTTNINALASTTTDPHSPHTSTGQPNLISGEDLAGGLGTAFAHNDSFLRATQFLGAGALANTGGSGYFNNTLTNTLTGTTPGSVASPNNNTTSIIGTEIPISNTAINEHLVIIGSDSNFRITLWNAAAERVTGYRSDEVMGQLITSIVDEKSMDGLKRILNHSNTTATRSVFMNSVRVLGKNENVVDLRATLTSSILRNSKTVVAVCGTAHENFHRTNHAYVVRELNVQLQHDLTMLLHFIHAEHNANLSPNSVATGVTSNGVIGNISQSSRHALSPAPNSSAGMGARRVSGRYGHGPLQADPLPNATQSLSTPPAGFLADTANGISLAGLLSVQSNAVSPPTESHTPEGQQGLEQPTSVKERSARVHSLQGANALAAPAMVTDAYGPNVVSTVYSSGGKHAGAGGGVVEGGHTSISNRLPSAISIPNSFSAGAPSNNNNSGNSSAHNGIGTKLVGGAMAGGTNADLLIELVDLKLRQCLQLANLGTWANVSRISSRMADWEQRSSDTLVTGLVRKYLNRLDLVFKNKAVMPEVFSIGAASVEAALQTVFQATSGRLRCEVTYNPIALDSDGFIEFTLTSLSSEDLSAAFGGCLMYANNASAALAGGLLSTVVPTIPGVTAASVINPSTSPIYHSHNVAAAKASPLFSNLNIGGGGGHTAPTMSVSPMLPLGTGIAAPYVAVTGLNSGYGDEPTTGGGGPLTIASRRHHEKEKSVSNALVGASISALPTTTFNLPSAATIQQRSFAQTLQRHVVDVGGIVCTHDTQTLLTSQASPHTLHENRAANTIFIRVPVRLTRTINKSGSMGSSLSFIGAGGGGGSVISHNSNLNATFAAVSEYCSVAVYEPNAFFRHSICDLVWSLGQAVMIIHSFEGLQKTLRTPNIRVDCIVISVDDEMGLEMARFLLEPRGHTKDYFASVTASPLAVSAGVGVNAAGNVALADKYTVALTAEQLLTADRVAKVFDQRTIKNKNARVHTIVKPFRRSHVSAMLRDATTRRSEAQLRIQQDEKNRKLFQLHRNAPWQRGGLLGKGAFGNVYEGFNTLTKGRMAVKEIYTEIMDKKKEIEFANEIAVMCELTHPNIVQYLYCEKGEKSILLFMELCEGGHLGSCIAKQANKRLTLTETINFTRQLVSALAYLHSMNFAHRDLKPENVLLTSEGDQIKLTDFGTAARVLIGEKPFTETAGTIRYMAPEVFNGEPYGTACDVWSIGIMVLDMLGAPVPWLDGKDFFAINEFYTTTIYDPRNPHPIVLPNELPAEVRSFVSACLEVDQGSRALMSTLSHHPLLLDKVSDQYYVSGYDVKLAAANFDAPRADSPTGSNADDDDDELIHNFAPGDHLPSEQVRIHQHNLFNGAMGGNNVSGSANTTLSATGVIPGMGVLAHSLLGTNGGSSHSGFGAALAVRTTVGGGPNSYASISQLPPTVPLPPVGVIGLPTVPSMGDRLPQLPPFAQQPSLPSHGGKNFSTAVLNNVGIGANQAIIGSAGDLPTTPSRGGGGKSYSPSTAAASASTLPQGLISSAMNSPLIPQAHQAQFPPSRSNQKGLITLPPQILVGGAPTVVSKHPINNSPSTHKQPNPPPFHLKSVRNNSITNMGSAVNVTTTPTLSTGGTSQQLNTNTTAPHHHSFNNNQHGSSFAESSGSDIVPFRVGGLGEGGINVGGGGFGGVVGPSALLSQGQVPPGLQRGISEVMAESAPLNAIHAPEMPSAGGALSQRRNETYASTPNATTARMGNEPTRSAQRPGASSATGLPTPRTATANNNPYSVPAQLHSPPTRSNNNNNKLVSHSDGSSDESEGMIPFHK